MDESGLIVALVMAVATAAVDRYHRWNIKRIRKSALRSLLNDEKYQWRTLTTLQDAVAEDRKNTVKLLLEIGARRSLEGQDLWTTKGSNAL